MRRLTKTITIQRDAWEAAERLAGEEDRSVSRVIEILIRNTLLAEKQPPRRSKAQAVKP